MEKLILGVFILLILFGYGCTHTDQKAKIIIPQDYIGTVKIDFCKNTGVSEVFDNDILTLRLDTMGRLKVQSSIDVMHLAYECYYQDDHKLIKIEKVNHVINEKTIDSNKIYIFGMMNGKENSEKSNQNSNFCPNIKFYVGPYIEAKKKVTEVIMLDFNIP